MIVRVCRFETFVVERIRQEAWRRRHDPLSAFVIWQARAAAVCHAIRRGRRADVHRLVAECFATPRTVLEEWRIR